MAKKEKKVTKKSFKQELKALLKERFDTALKDIQHYWTPKKFESKFKKAIKLFTDGKDPHKKKAKKTSSSTKQEPVHSA